MKTYSQAPDVTDTIEKIQTDHHEDLEGVTVTGLFAFDTESSEPVLKHGGYPAGAVVHITPLKDRALGVADATIVVDRAGWLALSQRQRNALLDHELTHLTRKVDKESAGPVCDALDRPKLVMRRHDHQFGWFDEVAQRHGEASPEVRQARVLMEISGQLYFDFEPRATAKPKRSRASKPAPAKVATSADGDTPEQARDKAHERERRIAQQIQDDRDRLN
jgi:hypothetical protein